MRISTTIDVEEITDILFPNQKSTNTLNILCKLIVYQTSVALVKLTKPPYYKTYNIWNNYNAFL